MWDLLEILSKLIKFCSKSEKLRVKSCNLKAPLLPHTPEAFCQECFFRSSPEEVSFLLALMIPHIPQVSQGRVVYPPMAYKFLDLEVGTCPTYSPLTF